MPDRNDSRSRLDIERNRARKFVKDQMLQKLRGPANTLTTNVPDGGDSPVDTGSMTPGDFQTALNRMIEASGGKLSVTSGTRTPERQRQLWEQALAKYGDPEIADNWVARPGTSNHEKGEAADLAYADAAARAWAHENADDFGLNFPMGHEPWHVERIDKSGGGSHSHGESPAPVGPSSPGLIPTGATPAFKIESGWEKNKDADPKDQRSDYGLREYVESKYKPKMTPTAIPQMAGGMQGGTVGQDGRKTTGDPFLDEIIYGGVGHPGESDFRTDADNPTSTAFGIGQLIESNRRHYGQRLGIDPNTQNEAEQLALMNAYIKDRYGSAEAAAQFRRQHGWY